MARGISLHVGVNKVDPDHYDGWDGALQACEQDARDMQALADARGFESSILLTAHATSAAVVGAIERAAQELAGGDFFFLTYAGHGGQVPDAPDGDEADRSDETWLLYDRQLVDDELWVLWSRFEPSVRIFVLSDSCHSGTVTRNIDGSVPSVVATRAEAEEHSPRFRAMPRDVMIATYKANRATYDGIQESAPQTEQLEEGGVGATVLLISGCQDDQLSLDGFSNGFFTEQLLTVWDGGAWAGSYSDFHEAIRSRMPDSQQPNYTRVGAADDAFERQDPLAIG